MQEVLSVLLQALEHNYLLLKAGDKASLTVQYLNNLYWRYEERLFKSEDFFNGSIQGIDDSGKLIIRVKGEDKYFSFKEVEFIH